MSQTEAYHVEDEVQQRAYDAQLMRRLLAYVRPYRTFMVAAVLLLFVSALFSSVVPLLNWRAISLYINNPARIEMEHRVQSGDSAAAPALRDQAATDKRGLYKVVVLIAVLMVAEAVIRFAQMLIVAWLGQKAMLKMRVEIFSHLQKMSLRFLDRNPVGRLVTRVTNDVEKLQETIISGIVQVINDLSIVFVILGFMLYNNWRLALIMLSPIPFVFVTGVVFRKYARDSYLEIRRRIARLNSCMQENVSGMRIVSIFNREALRFEQYRRFNADHRDEWFSQVRYYAIYFPIVDFLGTLSVALIILYGGHQILRGQVLFGAAADIGMFFAYVQWSERLYGPIRTLADRYNLLLEAMASSERVFELLDTPEDIPNRPGAPAVSNLRGEVQFNDIWFAYEPGQWVLKGIQLDIRPGERVAIVGHTGAGKTSLVNILSRFYDVQRGSVCVDGIDVRDYEKTSLRRNIGVVLQDVFLFSGSIEQNIRLSNPDLPSDKIRACAEYVNAGKFIERLPSAYAYNVGERGANLSTGQRQLLAFARVLAHNPRILVLDEATSSIDPESEALIQDAIAKLMQDRTSIVIAHRLSTVQHADRIVVMHHGEIREIGTHQQLLARRGLYYTLYRLQYKDQDISRP
ncbi:MAG: ABC transporter ATP-binding protein [Candidatus Hydrogenedentes bacterium]|nr:ABC transporter ATP-binding protein [Candidatus Hydrogenedentota bacterium]